MCVSHVCNHAMHSNSMFIPHLFLPMILFSMPHLSCPPLSCSVSQWVFGDHLQTQSNRLLGSGAALTSSSHVDYISLGVWHGLRSSGTEKGGREGHKNLILLLLLFSAYCQSFVISCHGSPILNELRGHWISASGNLDYSAKPEPPHWEPMSYFF